MLDGNFLQEGERGFVYTDWLSFLSEIIINKLGIDTCMLLWFFIFDVTGFCNA